MDDYNVERDRVGNRAEMPDDEQALCPPLSVRFRNVANNMARMIEQMEDGEFDPGDVLLQRNTCHQMEALVAQADRLRNNLIIRWRKGKLGGAVLSNVEF